MDEFWPDSEESMLQIFVFILVSIAYHYKDTYYNKQQQITSSIEGEEYLKEILQQAHPRRCFEVLRMPLETFLSLNNWLIRHTDLADSRQVSAPQKLAIFLSICGHGMSQRVTAERFRHSLQTISR